MMYKFIILCGRYRFFFFLIVVPWFGHVFSNKGRFGHKRKLSGFVQSHLKQGDWPQKTRRKHLPLNKSRCLAKPTCSLKNKQKTNQPFPKTPLRGRLHYSVKIHQIQVTRQVKAFQLLLNTKENNIHKENPGQQNVLSCNVLRSTVGLLWV